MGTNIKEEKQISQFCDTLMNVTGAVSNLRNPNDSAIVLCSDGKTISSRQCGLYSGVLGMLYVKMLNDDDFAELIVEAAMRYSRNMTKTGTSSKEADNDGKEDEDLIKFD